MRQTAAGKDMNTIDGEATSLEAVANQRLERIIT
jgi:hypothetical protein